MSELNVQVEELSPVVRRVNVAVPAERVATVTDAVYQRLGRTVKLRGYRQGRVPRRVLEKHFADQVRGDVAREVVDQTFSEALGTIEIHPVGSPAVEPQELREGEEFRYSARVEVRPEVKLQQYKGLEVKVAEARVDDAQVDQRLEQMRDSAGSYVPVEDRDVVQTGDFASVRYEVDIEGSGRPPDVRENALIRVEPGLFLSGHGEQLVGAKVGETCEFKETFGAEAPEQLAGKQAGVKVLVEGIKKRELPALDDDFARDMDQGVETIDALRAKVRAEMQAQTATENQGRRRQALLDALIEKNPLEVPPSMVSDTADRMVDDVLGNFRRSGLKLPQDILARFKEDVMPRAMADVKVYFLLDAVAEAEKIEVTNEEIDARIDEIAVGENAQSLRAQLREPRRLMGLLGALQQEKALAKVESEAVVTVVAEEPASEDNAAAES